MVDIFLFFCLGPAMVGAASGEGWEEPSARRSAARLEPRRITGVRAGRDGKFACGAAEEEAEAAARSWGAEEKRERCSAPRPAPRASLRQLADCWNSESRERAPYIEPGSRAAAGQSAPGEGTER